MEFQRSVAASESTHDTIATRFERQARATPDNLAIVMGGVSLTYRKLDAMAANIAAHIASASSLPERPIAILMEKGPLAVAAMLGAAKSGRVFFPLAPYPPEPPLRPVPPPPR